MLTITTTFTVPNLTPRGAVNWWLNLNNDTYRQWHPDHRAWTWHRRNGSPVARGTAVTFHETFGRFDLKVKAKLVELDPAGYLKFSVKGAPATFSFTYEMTSGGETRVTYRSDMGFASWPGRILDPLINRLYPKEEYGALITSHVKEEHRLIAEKLR